MKISQLKLIGFLAVFNALILTFFACGTKNDYKDYKINFKVKKSYYYEQPDSPYFFAGILNVCYNSKYIYVSDWKRVKIKIFDHNFKFIREIGRKGEGPGEFKQIFADLKCDNRNFYVLTISYLHIFDKEGNFKKRILVDILPRNFYLLKSKFLFRRIESAFAFYISDFNGKIIKKFYKKEKIHLKKCRESYSTPFAYLTNSNDFLVFNDLKYEIKVIDLNTYKTKKLIKRDVGFDSVKCKKMRIKNYELYSYDGGYSYMVEDKNNYYYFYWGKNKANKIDVYNKNFRLKWSGKYDKKVKIFSSWHEKNTFLGIYNNDWDKLSVIKLIKGDIIK